MQHEQDCHGDSCSEELLAVPCLLCFPGNGRWFQGRVLTAQPSVPQLGLFGEGLCYEPLGGVLVSKVGPILMAPRVRDYPLEDKAKSAPNGRVLYWVAVSHPLLILRAFELSGGPT